MLDESDFLRSLLAAYRLYPYNNSFQSTTGSERNESILLVLSHDSLRRTRELCICSRCLVFKPQALTDSYNISSQSTTESDRKDSILLILSHNSLRRTQELCICSRFLVIKPEYLATIRRPNAATEMLNRFASLRTSLEVVI